MSIRSHRDLEVWRQSVELALDVYRITRKLPPEERFGLTSQSRRSAVSISLNIAEGHGRRTRGEYCQAVGNARGSHRELETLLYFLHRLDYVDRATLSPVCKRANHVGALLEGLFRSLLRPPRP